MKALRLAEEGKPLSVLCLGAHSDDIEIGAGGTLLSWIAGGAKLNVDWCVLGATDEREVEARSSASEFLRGAADTRIDIQPFRNSFFPEQGHGIKEWFERLKSRVKPDVIFTHRRADAHQDHRETARHTWATFRDHMIIEYEVPKWDGDMGQPNLYVPLPEAVLERKIELLMRHFSSQRSRKWFDADTFRGLARLRGMECSAPQRFAEAFFGNKILLA